MPTWTNNDISQDTRDVQHEWDGWHPCGGPRLHPAADIASAYMFASRYTDVPAFEDLVVPEKVGEARADFAAGRLNYLAEFRLVRWGYNDNDTVTINLESRLPQHRINEADLTLRWIAQAGGWRVSGIVLGRDQALSTTTTTITTVTVIRPGKQRRPATRLRRIRPYALVSAQVSAGVHVKTL